MAEHSEIVADPDSEPELAAADDPFDLFAAWFSEAERSEPNDHNAMTLATATAAGVPSARMVLLKGVDGADAPARGFVFYTNLESRKGGELLDNPNAALCFHWKSLQRQIRIEGGVSLVDDAEADSYYHSRPRGSQIGAWASAQSRPLKGRGDLIKQVAKVTARYPLGEIPRPPHWSGFRLVPRRIEFWRNRQFRLHDRLVYAAAGAGWRTERLYP